jgi:hypothetical protein
MRFNHITVHHESEETKEVFDKFRKNINVKNIIPASLDNLIAFCKENTRHFELKTNALSYYKNSCQKYWGYYLGASDKKLKATDLITYELIQKTDEQNYRKSIGYQPYNSTEYAMIQQCLNNYDALKEVFMMYQILDEYLHELWRPPNDSFNDNGGIMYQIIFDQTLLRKAIHL